MSDVVSSAAPVVPRVQRRLPRIREGYQVEVSIAGSHFEFTVDVVDGELGAVHLRHARHGSFGSGMSHSLSWMINDALRYGMPLEELVAELLGQRFEPSGFSDDPDIGWVHSPLDYLARRLAMDFLPPNRQRALGVATQPRHAVPTGSVFSGATAAR